MPEKGSVVEVPDQPVKKPVPKLQLVTRFAVADTPLHVPA
jgi:hypothetical protein